MRSNVRVARVRSAVTEAVLSLTEREPDLTYEEIIEAMTDVTSRYAQHLRVKEGVVDEPA